MLMYDVAPIVVEEMAPEGSVPQERNGTKYQGDKHGQQKAAFELLPQRCAKVAVHAIEAQKSERKFAGMNGRGLQADVAGQCTDDRLEGQEERVAAKDVGGRVLCDDKGNDQLNAECGD